MKSRYLRAKEKCVCGGMHKSYKKYIINEKSIPWYDIVVYCRKPVSRLSFSRSFFIFLLVKLFSIIGSYFSFPEDRLPRRLHREQFTTLYQFTLCMKLSATSPNPRASQILTNNSFPSGTALQPLKSREGEREIKRATPKNRVRSCAEQRKRKWDVCKLWVNCGMLSAALPLHGMLGLNPTYGLYRFVFRVLANALMTFV